MVNVDSGLPYTNAVMTSVKCMYSWSVWIDTTNIQTEI